MKMNLAVWLVTRSATIDVVGLPPQPHGNLAGHFEATRREWTGFLDPLYVSLGVSETRCGISVSTASRWASSS